jgi:hypothetical protein
MNKIVLKPLAEKKKLLKYFYGVNHGYVNDGKRNNWYRKKMVPINH